MVNPIQRPISIFPELHTDRLILRELKANDAEAIYRLFADDAVTKYYDLETFTNLRQAEELIKRQKLRFERGEGIRWGIAQVENNVVIGTVGCIFSDSNLQGSIGYDLAQGYWRKGIMSEALRMVIHYGFASLKLNRIQALVIPGNTPSIALLKKLGFTEEGMLREYAFFKGRFYDLICFSILKREYNAPSLR